jgi:peptide/nickel transport system ATP-binding protein
MTAPANSDAPAPTPATPGGLLLTAQGLVKTFAPPRLFPWLPARSVRAIDGVDLSVPRGHTVGIVGESGSGKTTLGRLLVRLLEPDAGQIVYRDVTGQATALTAADPARLRALRRRLQIVFQDPYRSLNPARTAGEIVGEGLRIHQMETTAARQRERAAAALARVGLPRDAVDRLPAAFSGGQRQRIALARALVLEPELVVCDEITSALDTRTQAHILELLAALRRELGLSLVFISHDLHTVAQVSDHVVVLRHGRIVEQGPPVALFAAPQADYTRALVAALPTPDPARRRFRRRWHP